MRPLILTISNSMKNIDLVYTNGDSYAIPRTFKICGEHIADYYNAEHLNKAVMGSANSRILRTSLRDLLDLKNQYNNILACVSLSFIMRTDLWDREHEHDRWRHGNDGDFMCIGPMAHKNWATNIKNIVANAGTKYNSFCRNYATYYDMEAETVRLLEKIILFTNWCKNNNIEYIIFSPMYQESIDFSAPFVSNFYKEINHDKNILNPFDFSFLQWCLDRNHSTIDDHEAIVNGKQYQVGHMGETGHKDFAKFLIENYLN